MRELKFRAWDKESKDMLSDVSLWNDDFTNYLNEHIDYLKDKCELMQYTGLKDKQGVEIYEGDIVKIYSKVGNTSTEGGIYYNKRVCGFMVDDAIFKQYLPLTEDDDIEVIGNIYENPELLEMK